MCYARRIQYKVVLSVLVTLLWIPIRIHVSVAHPNVPMVIRAIRAFVLLTVPLCHIVLSVIWFWNNYVCSVVMDIN